MVAKWVVAVMKVVKGGGEGSEVGGSSGGGGKVGGDGGKGGEVGSCDGNRW